MDAGGGSQARDYIDWPVVKLSHKRIHEKSGLGVVINRLQNGLAWESGSGNREPRPQKLVDRVRSAIRLRHYSPRTEEAYVGWTAIRDFSITSGIPPKWAMPEYGSP